MPVQNSKLLDVFVINPKIQGINFCRSTQKPSFVDGNRCVDQFVSINFTVVDHVSRSVPKSVDQFLDHLVTWWKLLMMSAFTKRCFGDTSLIFTNSKKKNSAMC